MSLDGSAVFVDIVADPALFVSVCRIEGTLRLVASLWSVSTSTAQRTSRAFLRLCVLGPPEMGVRFRLPLGVFSGRFLISCFA